MPQFAYASRTDVAETAAETSRVMTMLLGGIAAVSLLVGGLGRELPLWLDISPLAVAILCFVSLFVLYLRGDEKTSRVPRSTFWTLIGCFFAVALFWGQLMISLPSEWTETHRVIFTAYILLMWPLIVVGVVVQIRRWHDRNKSGWWILLNLIPFLGSAWALIELGFIRGTKGPNRFGPDPLVATPPA